MNGYDDDALRLVKQRLIDLERTVARQRNGSAASTIYDPGSGPGTTTDVQGEIDELWAAIGAIPSGSVATDAIWDAAGDLAVGSGANTAAKLAKGADSTVLTVDPATHLLVWAAPAGGSLEVKEADGTPDVTGVTTIVVPNGSLTDDTGGQVTLTFPAGGGITVEDEGTPLSTTADTLDFVGAGVSASGSGTTKTITISGGGGGSPYYLDTLTLDGTYGDDFDAGALDAKWTRVGLVAGQENFVADSWIELDLATVTGGRGYYQTLTPDDEIIVDLAFTLFGAGQDALFGPYVVSNTGTGVGGGMSLADSTLRTFNVASYVWSSSDLATRASALADKAWDRGIKLWMRLEKRLDIWIARYSLNGSVWNEETPGVVPSAFTAAKVGFGRLTTGGSSPYRAAVDRFNCTVLGYGNNLVITPTSGTATYSASSEYSGSYSADKAAAGRLTGEWAASGTGLPLWWKVVWSVGQTLNRVLLFSRGSEHMGNVHLTFSDGSTWLVPGPLSVGGVAVEFPTKSGITSMEVDGDGGANGFPGLSEVEAYYAS